MLFPNHELVRTFVRDRWLIKRYCPPNNPPNKITLKHQPSSMLPGGITYISGMVSQRRVGFAPVYRDSGKIFPPKELIAKVDQAYFRESLREEVHRWFARRGFDRAQRTIPKHLFETTVQAEFGQLPPELVKPIEKGAARAKLRKPRQPRKSTTPAEEPGETYSTQLINLMREMSLAKSGLRLSEVREKVRPRFRKKYPDRPLPDDVTINRAYKKYKSAKDTRAE
jgi:hypothetical protein